MSVFHWGAIFNESHWCLFDVPPLCVFMFLMLDDLTVMLHIGDQYLLLLFRPVSYSDAAMRGRSRPLQPGGAAAHPQAAGWRQRRGDRGQRKRGGELPNSVFSVSEIHLTQAHSKSEPRMSFAFSFSSIVLVTAVARGLAPLCAADF